MKARIIDLLRNELKFANIDEASAVGTFNISKNSPVLFPGGVYGFFAQLDNHESQSLFVEASNRALANITLQQFVPIFDDLYVLYWGKDKSIGARPYQHLGNPVGTGAIRLSTYSSLQNKDIICSTIVVSDFNAFEIHLQQKYPQLLKTTTRQL